MKNKSFLLVILSLLVVMMFGCSKEMTNQTPAYTAMNLSRFAKNDSYEQFRAMFDEKAGEKVSEELFLSLQQSYTDLQTHSTCHFIEMENGDIWMLKFAPAEDGEGYKITSLTLLDEEQISVMKPLISSGS